MCKRRTKLQGWGSGLLGVVIFSGSLPATRLAVAGFPPLFLTAARAVIAAALGAVLLGLLRTPRPTGRDLASLATVTAGVVLGFPLLTALALRQISSARSLVFIGLLPLTTAVFGAIRGGERPRPLFWLFSLLGSATLTGFALTGRAPGSTTGDLTMLSAIVLCGLGYAEGAVLSRRLGGWQVICWALLLSLPAVLPIALVTMPENWSRITPLAWIGLGYVSLFSMLIGFVFWYRGLALGGTVSVGQLQLLQPFLGLLLAGWLLHEPVDWRMLSATGCVIASVALARRFA